MVQITNNHLNRRFVLKSLGIILFLIPLKLFFSMLKQRLSCIKKNLKATEIKIDQLGEISIIDDVIIIEKNGRYFVFSAHCTHLGCIIKDIEKNELVCPCHGSRFSLNGEIIKGPANRRLTALDFKVDHKKGKIIVESFI